MRKTAEKQMPLTTPTIDHPKAIELKTISQILEQNNTIIDLVCQDLSRGCQREKGGASGMSAEQVLRAALLKQMHGYTYRDLAFISRIPNRSAALCESASAAGFSSDPLFEITFPRSVPRLGKLLIGCCSSGPKAKRSKRAVKYGSIALSSKPIFINQAIRVCCVTVCEC